MLSADRRVRNLRGGGVQFATVPVRVLYDNGAKAANMRCISFYLTEERRLRLHRLFTFEDFERVVKVDVGEREFESMADVPDCPRCGSGDVGEVSPLDDCHFVCHSCGRYFETDDSGDVRG